MFKSLDDEQRTALARDWESGYRVLLLHRKLPAAQAIRAACATAALCN